MDSAKTKTEKSQRDAKMQLTVQLTHPELMMMAIHNTMVIKTTN